jgi:hypothetical protein
MTKSSSRSNSRRSGKTSNGAVSVKRLVSTQKKARPESPLQRKARLQAMSRLYKEQQ